MTVWTAQTAWNLIFSILICATSICGTKSDLFMFCNATAMWTVMSDFMRLLRHSRTTFVIIDSYMKWFILPVHNFAGFCSQSHYKQMHTRLLYILRVYFHMTARCASVAKSTFYPILLFPLLPRDVFRVFCTSFEKQLGGFCCGNLETLFVSFFCACGSVQNHDLFTMEIWYLPHLKQQCEQLYKKSDLRKKNQNWALRLAVWT